MRALVGPDEIAELIAPGSFVVVGQGTSEPLSLTQALVRHRHRLAPLTVFLGAVFSDTFVPDACDGIDFIGYGAIGAAGRLAKAGRLDVLALHYSRLPDHFAARRPDVVLLQASRCDEEPTLSFGLANDYIAAAARAAKTVIAEVNAQAPWTYGAEIAADMRIDFALQTSRPPAAAPVSRFGTVEQAIAAHVAPLVVDGATIQTGIGAVPDAILSALTGHRDLGFHSGMIGDRAAALIESGVVTNARKPFDHGISIAGALFGSERLNRFAHRNASLRLRPPAYTHGPDVLARLPNFVAINSAIEVDLTGQVNAEAIGGRYIGAVGGQSDFVRGANAASGGRAIIALPATARDGAASRIVATLDGPVTSPRADADVVVTEWGIAELRGQTLAQRARRMIEIAAPPFREALSRAAHRAFRAV